MRSLVLGANGQLGRDLVRAFKSAGETLGCTREEADITNEDQLYKVVEHFGPDIIVNAAAYTHVDNAEDHLDEAFLVNEAGARNVAQLAAYHQIPVVYFSTDYVFGEGADTPIPPDAPIAPISIYGRSKAAGEKAVRKANAQHFIIRTAWLYGPGGNNFVEKILRLARERDSIKVVEDEVGSPTHTRDLAEATYYLVRARKFGTYHVVNRGACSRYEQALAIRDIAELDCEITPCPATDFPSKAQRPRYSVLDPTLAESVTQHTMRPWKDALLEYMQRRENTQ